MEVMEDGNLMDKVLILIQRDMEYYTTKQTVLQETICPGIVGGRLDFPRSASFAAVKLVLWWEEEFLAAYRKGSGFMQEETGDSEKSMVTSGGCGGIVKASDPAKFISLITKSSDELLEHLHILTQEALDHADLTVLTGTIGAAALLKNCLWCYIQTGSVTKLSPEEDLQTSQKKYQDMGEALAERLLDLHCRLLSLYILQDADSLDWENVKPFCESERGSYVIQMWWLYMQGTKEDLWNTVPPKMAQRVFSGMLNESLTILTVRYSQALPSQNRSLLYSVDISNLLLCITKLLPAICDSADEFVGINLNSQSKILRDVHSKCQELLTCLLLRSSPLDILHKVFRKGLEKIEIFKPKTNTPAPWIIFTMANLFPDYHTPGSHSHEFPAESSIMVELLVLLPQPQPNWSLLLKVLCMENCKIAATIFSMALTEYKKREQNHNPRLIAKSKCGGFLCSGDGTCKGVDKTGKYLTAQHYYDLIHSITYIILIIGNERDFHKLLLKPIITDANWVQCFDKRQVWNQKRPAWFEAIVDLIKPFLPPIMETVVNAVKTGASMYQGCSIILSSFVQLWECMNVSLVTIANHFQELLPTTVVPIGKSALLQFLISGLYSELLNKGSASATVTFKPDSKAGEASGLDEVFEGSENSDEAVALAIAEALCSIDEDNKHTEDIEELLEQARMCKELNEVESDGCKRIEINVQVLEVLASDLLLTDQGKKGLKVLHHFIINNHEWLIQQLRRATEETPILPNIVQKTSDTLLHTMFYIGYEPFDQLLTGQWAPNWLGMFNIPMGLTLERISSQISCRWEFRDGNFINTADGHIITSINTLLKQSTVHPQ